MAKMKVHELAKELEKQSKEIVAFLQDKGYEVKAAQSSIEDDAIALVREMFGKSQPEKSEKKADAVKTDNTAKAADTVKADNTAKAEKAESEAKPVASENKQAAPEAKKKKKIIFVSNPHNSKMPGNRPPQQSADKRPANANRNASSGQAPHKLIRPTQKPIPVTAEPYDVRQKQQQEKRLERKQQEKQENREKENVQSKQSAQEKQYNNHENRRTEGQSRQNYNGSQGGNRPAAPSV
ncbi:MAG: hypothetical protein HDR30_05420, partial [Lachnospiraceae bacterium]|nr:hypothetical protein [Lachnospiraceae bacterium]